MQVRQSSPSRSGFIKNSVLEFVKTNLKQGEIDLRRKLLDADSDDGGKLTEKE